LGRVGTPVKGVTALSNFRSVRESALTDSKKQKLGIVVVLNGPSSSGKTTLATALKARGFVALSVDDFHRFSPRSIPNDEVLFGALNDALFASAASFAQHGFPVVVDTVFVSDSILQAALSLLDDVKLALVALNAPIKVLEQRECERGDRQPGLARSQYEHVLRDATYALSLD